jgi:predicted RND superfamily exporter protein
VAARFCFYLDFLVNMGKKKKQKRKNKAFKKISHFFSGQNRLISLAIAFSLVTTGLILVKALIFQKQEPELIIQEIKPSQMERKIQEMVSGHPILEMTPYIATKDREVAAYLVAIAKKESNWGKRSPQKSGKNCYNYWGYRGNYNETNSGYSCFESPEQAVNVVGERIEELVEKNIDTPQEIAVVWKCGWDCSNHKPGSVQKWIKDVNYYFKKVNN